MRQQVFEDRVLDGFTLRRGLDDQVGRPYICQRQCRRDTAHCCGFVLRADLVTRDLPLQVAINDRQRLLKCILGDIGHGHIIACQSKNMRDAIAHLARANNADFVDVHGPRPRADNVRRCARLAGNIGAATPAAQEVENSKNWDKLRV
jgi:hypothetical protein